MTPLCSCFYGNMFSPHLTETIVWEREACPVRCGKLRVLGIQRPKSTLKRREDDSWTSVLKTSHTVGRGQRAEE